MLLKRDDVNLDNQVAVAGRHSIVLLGMDMGVVKMLLEQDGVNPDKPAILLCGGGAATIPGSSGVTRNFHHIHSSCFLAVDL